jgi:hypothetical protein
VAVNPLRGNLQQLQRIHLPTFLTLTNIMLHQITQRQAFASLNSTIDRWVYAALQLLAQRECSLRSTSLVETKD